VGGRVGKNTLGSRGWEVKQKLKMEVRLIKGLASKTACPEKVYYAILVAAIA
jgi:hypothetical protein